MEDLLKVFGGLAICVVIVMVFAFLMPIALQGRHRADVVRMVETDLAPLWNSIQWEVST